MLYKYNYYSNKKIINEYFYLFKFMRLVKNVACWNNFVIVNQHITSNLTNKEIFLLKCIVYLGWCSGYK